MSWPGDDAVWGIVALVVAVAVSWLVGFSIYGNG